MIVETCTGTHENRLQSRIGIYPNPVHGTLVLSITGSEKTLNVLITDISGHRMYEGTFGDLAASCTRRIDVSGFAKGIYLIRLVNDSRVFVGTFTVE